MQIAGRTLKPGGERADLIQRQQVDDSVDMVVVQVRVDDIIKPCSPQLLKKPRHERNRLKQAAVDHRGLNVAAKDKAIGGKTELRRDDREHFVRVRKRAMHYADYKTVLLANNTMNIYRGCSHGCIYCDSRSACYQIGHPFEDIEVKRGADKILDNQLLRRRKKAMINSGSMCDPYIPLEDELRLTRRCLEAVARRGFGLSILSKSDRMLRDMDLFEEINRRQKCVVCTTLTTFDETLCKKLEPNVSATAARVNVLMECKKRGIPTVVWLTPILPFLGDTEANVNGLLDYCVAAGVRGVLSFGMGLTLREGDREYFYAQLDRLFPGLRQRYIDAFGLSYVCNSPNSGRLMALLAARCEKHGILYDPDAVFRYLRELPEEPLQLSMFD